MSIMIPIHITDDEPDVTELSWNFIQVSLAPNFVLLLQYCSISSPLCSELMSATCHRKIET